MQHPLNAITSFYFKIDKLYNTLHISLHESRLDGFKLLHYFNDISHSLNATGYMHKMWVILLDADSEVVTNVYIKT